MGKGKSLIRKEMNDVQYPYVTSMTGVEGPRKPKESYRLHQHVGSELDDDGW